MPYQIEFIPQVAKQLKRLPNKILISVVKEIIALSNNPRPHGYIQLIDRDGFRIRIGKYRIIYEIDEGNQRVRILSVLKRDDNTYK